MSPDQSRRLNISAMASFALIIACQSQAVQAQEWDLTQRYNAPILDSCELLGAGEDYFLIPGAEACLAISGDISIAFNQDVFSKTAYSAIEAAINISTFTESEFGTIGAHATLAKSYSGAASRLQQDNLDTIDIEAAYITLGNAYFGHLRSLVDTSLPLSSLEHLQPRQTVSTLGYMAHTASGQFAAAIEYHRAYEAPYGLPGSIDDGLYAAWSIVTIVDDWMHAGASSIVSLDDGKGFIEGTLNFAAGHDAKIRLAASLNQIEHDKAITLSAASDYAFTDKLSAFTGVMYHDRDKHVDLWIGNVGAAYEISENLTFKGEAYYAKGVGGNHIGSRVSLYRAW